MALSVRIAGSGPAVLLLHGLPSPSSDFDALVARLSGRFTTLVPDLPGYGQSPWSGKPDILDEGHRELCALLVAQKVSDVAVIGFSYGAYRALRLAIEGPVKVRQVVTLGGLEDLSVEEKAGMAAFARPVLAGADLKVPPWPELMAQRMLSPAWAASHPEDSARVANWVFAPTPQALGAELTDCANLIDLGPRLSTINVPVLVRVGELDGAAPRAHSERIAKLCPHSELQVVGGVGHALLYEDGAPTISAIESALHALRSDARAPDRGPC